MHTLFLYVSLVFMIVELFFGPQLAKKEICECNISVGRGGAQSYDMSSVQVKGMRTLTLTHAYAYAHAHTHTRTRPLAHAQAQAHARTYYDGYI